MGNGEDTCPIARKHCSASSRFCSKLPSVRPANSGHSAFGATYFLALSVVVSHNVISSLVL